MVGAGARSFLLDGCSRITAIDCHADAPVPRNGNPGWTLQDCSEMTLADCSSTEAPVHGFEVIGTSREVQLTACRTTDPGAYGFHLAGVRGASLTACTVIGGVQAVNCDAEDPPVSLRVVGCRFTGYADRSLKGLPSTAVCLGNAEDGGLREGDRLGDRIGFFGSEPVSQPTVRGSRTDGAALTELLRAMVALGLVRDETSP